MNRRILLLLVLILLVSGKSNAQSIAPPLPQRTATLSSEGSLDFGTFILQRNSSGGWVTVNEYGNRTYGGDVYPMNGSYERPTFYFKLCPGRMVTVNFSKYITLSCSNPAENLTMTINKIVVGSSPVSLSNTTLTATGQTFISNKGCSDLHYLMLDATLNIPSTLSNKANFAGEYIGTISITLDHQ